MFRSIIRPFLESPSLNRYLDKKIDEMSDLRYEMIRAEHEYEFQLLSAHATGATKRRFIKVMKSRLEGVVRRSLYSGIYGLQSFQKKHASADKAIRDFYKKKGTRSPYQGIVDKIVKEDAKIIKDSPQFLRARLGGLHPRFSYRILSEIIRIYYDESALDSKAECIALKDNHTDNLGDFRLSIKHGNVLGKHYCFCLSYKNMHSFYGFKGEKAGQDSWQFMNEVKRILSKMV